jgi:hypothetical protein
MTPMTMSSRYASVETIAAAKDNSFVLATDATDAD